MQGQGLWPMFAFGFGGVFVITQMHGLGLSRWTRFALAGSIHRLCALGLQRARLGLAERDHPHPADRLPGSPGSCRTDWIRVMAGTLDMELENTRF
jgi:hypothetical protein